MGSRYALALALASSLGGVGACAGSGLEAQVYRGEDFAFRIGEVPPSWHPVDVSDAALAWRDASAAGTVVVNARCDKDGEDVPLSALTQHLFLKFTDRETAKEETVPFDGREALHTQITAKLDGVPKAFSVWVLKKDGCVFDLVYIADPSSFAAGVAAFDKFAQQLRVLPRSGDGAP